MYMQNALPGVPTQLIWIDGLNMVKAFLTASPGGPASPSPEDSNAMPLGS